MNNLQQISKDRYPDSEISEIQRKAFEEGYEAAKQEEKPQIEGIDAILSTCADYYSRGMSINAIKHYRDNTGCDLQTAMEKVGPKSAFALNIKNEINNGKQ